MIKIVNKDLFESKANFIVHQTNCIGIMGSGVAAQVAEKYPHVEKEYSRYLKNCKKNQKNALGTVQYVPVDNWAMVMCDTINNDRVEAYDEKYQYIVNLFGQASVGTGLQTDVNKMKSGFKDIYNKAKSINASVAMPYGIGCVRGGANWEDVYRIIKEIFTDIDVEICKFDKG